MPDSLSEFIDRVQSLYASSGTRAEDVMLELATIIPTVQTLASDTSINKQTLVLESTPGTTFSPVFRLGEKQEMIVSVGNRLPASRIAHAARVIAATLQPKKPRAKKHHRRRKLEYEVRSNRRNDRYGGLS